MGDVKNHTFYNANNKRNIEIFLPIILLSALDTDDGWSMAE